MVKEEILANFTDKCDIYFEDSLISKELIIKKYSDFFVSSLSDEKRSVSMALHTGSICFDIISVINAALGCVALDKTDADDIITSFSEGDMVLFKNERYRWLGTELRNDRLFLVLEQDGRGKNG